jgi:hypothetical protein
MQGVIMRDNIPEAAGGAAVCQHHGAAYGEFAPPTPANASVTNYQNIASGAAIAQAQIVTTKRCCIVVNAALLIHNSSMPYHYEIQRPLGTRRTTQEDELTTGTRKLVHHAAWEVLPAGTYDYYLVNRAGWTLSNYGSWIKIIASDCEG